MNRNNMKMIICDPEINDCILTDRQVTFKVAQVTVIGTFPNFCRAVCLIFLNLILL